MKTIPISLRSAFSSAELAAGDWFDGVKSLGSYWSRDDDSDLQSQLVKYFKQPVIKPLDQPYIYPLTKAYSVMLADIARDWQPTALVRVLSSSEIRPDLSKPNSLLARNISEILNIPDFTGIFFRTEPRKPMRMIDRLSGDETLRQRISYVQQDLFLTPEDIGGRVILIDDIYNLGATARVYTAALKKYCKADNVYSINIAAARFSGGKDGWGKLMLDVDKLTSIARSYLNPNSPQDAFDDAWIVRKAPDYHLGPDCKAIAGQAHRSFVFLARSERVPLPSLHWFNTKKRGVRMAAVA
jgi:hypothetical protein